MATKKFGLNTEPHEALVGAHRLLFKPEVLGTEFLDCYDRLQVTIRQLRSETDDPAETDTAAARQSTIATRIFLASLMLPESARQFVRWDVMVDGSTTSTYHDPEEAQQAAAEIPGAEVHDVGLQFPDRIFVDLTEWVAELYGGGRPPTSSGGSAPASPTPGRRGKGTSRSRA
ncbi:hypothetical protein ACIQGT_13800 [Streptomyces sp. NPDC093108]|uniref:hypothetical protein n=1 Tax=Streptomyces sp. NPDC093108 TaxID=3366030 RepID=UPI0038046670